MLQVTENGANITLSGKVSGTGDGVFWFSVALLFGAVAVAMAMSILPERLAIGALAALVVFSFVFNVLRQKQQKKGEIHIHSGILKVQPQMFQHNKLGSLRRFVVAKGDIVTTHGKVLLITGSDGKTKCRISGFDSEKEAQVMQAILQGQQFGKRKANIRMQSS